MKKLFTTLICLFVLQLTAQTVTVSGTVTDEFNVPLNGANIIIQGTKKGVQTDFDGNYTIDAKIGQRLACLYLGMNDEVIEIKKAGTINIMMTQKAEEIGEVVIRTYGIPKSERIYASPVTVIDGAEIENKPESDAIRSLVGKIPGARITGTSGAVGSGTNFTIRSSSSITGNNTPLFIVDGTPFNSGTNDVAGLSGGGAITSSRFLDLDPNNIESVKILRGLSATVLYGQEGRNGVVLITTKSGSQKEYELAPNKPYSERYLAAQEEARTRLANERTAMELGYESPYQSLVKSILASKDRMSTYLKLREANQDDPAFYVDVFDRFKKFDPEFAMGVLNSFVEVNSNDPNLLKVLAYKLEEQNKSMDAVKIYRKLLKILPDEPQSYRDLALILEDTGNDDEAVKLLFSITQRAGLDREYKTIIENDITRILSTSEQARETYNLKQSALKDVSRDMRVVIDWNRKDVDLDLKVIDPNLEIAAPDNPRTRSGGRLLSNNDTGFGPEIFDLEQLQTGSYYLKVGYPLKEGEILDVEGPTYVKLTIFRNYGRSNQTKEVQLVRISDDRKLQLMDRIAVL
ncbi:MAG: TonB-dependent receptor plug domain-containing protein [Bacteroidia bacterium]|nr:TonB-dependent receptor plug domain-containing protein [Bacteroidia bacterium]NNF31982.1 TonB-dependent receptor plug domain-containing protein [Flavobacteriaceae bacterium]MBT8276180.1 TonB-dependent receptor plug domain-containing protein [Bacteroidia bacterium]NNJ81911.1 TonB-dependent receptor plug domain-containing protein [Flavobacteriaceae bacterium]NNK52955.1 TonB-dependent receptor plug domain-containing protein [Flavobacteriaceae bacterium]